MSGIAKARRIFGLGRELFELGETIISAFGEDDPRRVEDILPDEMLSRIQYEITEAKLRAQYGGGS